MMARTKPRIELPFLTGGVAKKRRSFAARQLQGWFRTYPALRIAYAEARRRFVGVEGVCGMGVGRKFSESADRYGTAPESTGGLCLKVFVKIKKKEVSGRERIPAWIDVRVQRTARTTRVLLDVVSVGGTQRGQTGSGLQKGRGWPQAGRITPGRLFAFGTKAVDEMGDRPFRADEVNLGTTGAVIRFVNDRCYGISAGHVFTDPSLTVAPRPDGLRALGVSGREWEQVHGSDFFPEQIKTTEWIRDLMLFPFPASFRPDPSEVTWPDGFLRELATQEDIHRAVLAETATGFIWVDRKGSRPEAIPVDLEAASPLLSLPVDSHGVTQWMTYIATWPLRFLPGWPTTEPGDSGSPVFLWTEDNSRCRLLGMHFLEWRGHAYAMDARAFFSEVLLATPDQNVWFA